MKLKLLNKLQQVAIKLTYGSWKDEHNTMANDSYWIQECAASFLKIKLTYKNTLRIQDAVFNFFPILESQYYTDNEKKDLFETLVMNELKCIKK